MRRITPRQADYARAFRADRSPLVLLDPGLTVLDANPAYLRAAGRERGEVVGRGLLDTLPGAPTGPEADRARHGGEDSDSDRERHRDGDRDRDPDRDGDPGPGPGPGRSGGRWGSGVPAVLGASLRRVLRLRRPDVTPPQRVRVPSPGDPAGGTERSWAFHSTPLLDADGAVTGLLVRVEDATGSPAHRAQDGPAANDGTIAALETENAQLRTALRSRATIDRAVGIVMAERRVGPDAAFRVLVSLSQNTNVKLRDVAAALVHRTAGRDGPHMADGGPDGTPGPGARTRRRPPAV
ncbi:ANTAR domain-containing protein [Streptomyces sp. DH12]|uniref:ANTAR domain-containing protein n=1 Tax=Streptomyces sp. DH12 TaxID=2857010 RepID=UPI001E5B5B5C|nr:ANTAR domain-containing protein [Streptomyces sp. DH12]